MIPSERGSPELTFITNKHTSCRKLVLRVRVHARAGGMSMSSFMDKTTHGQCKEIERKLPCKGWTVEHGFIKDNVTRCAPFRSGEKAPMTARRPEPKSGPRARASLHQGLGDKFCNEQVPRRSFLVGAQGLSMRLSKTMSHFLQCTGLKWNRPCKGQGPSSNESRRFENVFSRTIIVQVCSSLG